MNFDGLYAENLGKLKIKDKAKLMNKQKVTLIFDISSRIFEGDIVDQISTICYTNMGHWPSDFCNETGSMTNTNRMQPSRNTGLTNMLRNRVKPRFQLKVNI